jgi:hypothetical protein
VLEHFLHYPLDAADRDAVLRETAAVERHLGERLMDAGATADARTHLWRSLRVSRTWDTRAFMLWGASLLPPWALIGLKKAKQRLRPGGPV